MRPSLNDRGPHSALSALPLKPGHLIALGFALLILGLIALGYVVGATLVSVVYVGVLMLIGGVLHLIHAWSVKRWSSFAFWTCSGLLYLLAGIFAVINPLGGAAVLTLFFGAFLIASAALRLWIWVQNRSQPGSVWMALSALLTLAVGLMIASGWPDNSVWVLGLILGIELLMQGWAALFLGLALKKQQP